MTVRFLPSADVDLDEIYAWIASHDEAAADRWLADLRAATWRIAMFPESAERASRSGRGARKLTVGDYKLLHRIVDGEVLVGRVVHGRRRQPRLKSQR